MTGTASQGLRWIFLGQGVMGAAALDALLQRASPTAVITQRLPGEAPVATLARTRDVPVELADNLGADPCGRWPHRFADLDLGVAACWPEILQPGALDAPARGWLNLHPSALPQWRGSEPVGWQLLARPATIGVSVHRMTERQDAGPVVARGRLRIADHDDRGTVLQRAGAALGRLTAQVLEQLAVGVDVDEEPQQGDEATWCPPVGTLPMADPRVLSADAAAQVVRAFSPEPGVPVATLPPSQRVAGAEVGPGLHCDDRPGQVVDRGAGRVAIACTDRWLRVRTWDVAAPSVAYAVPPGTTRLPRGSR